MKKLSILIIFGITLALPHKNFAYESTTTHPALTSEMVKFYNFSHPGQLTEEERGWLMQGSVDEDTPPRWINHFYDPVHDIAWTGDNVTGVWQTAVVAVRDALISAEPPVTALDWVDDRVVQNKYALYGGDRTWQQAIEYYLQGNKQEAFKTLGQVLHLIEDMSVPEHTRNDPHVAGSDLSPYEEYTRKYTSANLNIAQFLKDVGASPESQPTIEDYIKSVANYSNHYFFSKDTINDPQYGYPKIVRADSGFGYGVDEQLQEFPLALMDNVWNSNTLSYDKIYFLNDKSASYGILEAYFTHLSRKDVLAGAGIIDLFLKKVNGDAAVNQGFPNHLVTVDPNVSKWFTLPVISPVGEVYRLVNAAQDALGTLVILANQGTSYILGLFADSRSSAPPPIIPLPAQGAAVVQLPSGSSAKPSGMKLVITRPPLSGDNSGTVVVEILADPRGEVLGTSTTALDTSTTIPVSQNDPPPVNNGATSFTPSPPPPPPAPPPLPASTPTPSFMPSAMRITISWTPVDVGSGFYALYDVSAGVPGTLIATSTATSATQNIREVGRDYKYELRLADGMRETLLGDATLTVPSFYHRLSFYADPRASSSDLIDGFYANYPLVPDIFGHNEYQAAVFYLNRDPNPANNELVANPGSGFELPDPHGVVSFYVYGLQPGYCPSFGPGILITGSCLSAEDNHLVLSFGTSTAFSSSDYLTVAYYDLDNTGGFSGGNPTLALVATDGTKFSFGSVPQQAAPTTPGNLQTSPDLTHFTLGVSWMGSTDSDSPDSAITYQVNYSSSSLSDANWQSVGHNLSLTIPLIFPDTYTIAVRAVDDFGNMSAPATLTWNFPSGFTPSIFSGNVNAAGQYFTLVSGGTLASITVNTDNFRLPVGLEESAVCSLDLYDAAGSSTIFLAASETLNPADGVSSNYAYRGGGCAGMLTFTYASSSPVVLIPGHPYQWNFHFNPGYGQATVRFLGMMTNTAGGLFGDGSSITNAKFTVMADAGALFSN